MQCLIATLVLLLGCSNLASSQVIYSEIYPALQKNGLLDPYLTELIQEVSSNVVSESRRGRDVQINRPYDKDRVNIYVVVARAIRGNPLVNVGIDIDSVPRNALAHKESATIFIDGGLLRELVTLNMLFWEQGENMSSALSSYEVHGEDAFRGLWDPKRNPMVSSRQPGQRWLISLRGVLAFIIAHELGHIDSGVNLSTANPRTFRPKPGRDSNIYWLCPELVYPKVTRRRETEAKADEYALRLLIRLKGLHYQHGPPWYFLYLLNRGMIKAIPFASPALTSFLRQQYGSTFDTLKSRTSSASGPIEAFYPKTHPNYLLRLSQSMVALYNETPDSLALLTAWKQRLDQECEALRSRLFKGSRK